MMYHLNRWNYDWQVFSGVYHKDYTAGLGWVGNLKDAGFKGKVSCFTPYGSYADSSSAVVSLSVDYGFKKGLYLLASLLYNSLGGDSSINFIQLSTQTLSAKNMFPFRYTGLVQASYPFTPLFKGTLGAMYSPTGNSIILLPSLTYSISNNWVLDFVAQSFYAQQNNAYKPLGSAVYMRVKCGF